MNPTAQATAELYASAAWASAEPVQRNTQIIQQAWEMGSKTAAQLTQQSVDQLARTFGISGEEAQKTAQQSAVNLEVIIGSRPLSPKACRPYHRNGSSSRNHTRSKILTDSTPSFAVVHRRILPLCKVK